MAKEATSTFLLLLDGKRSHISIHIYILLPNLSFSFLLLLLLLLLLFNFLPFLSNQTYFHFKFLDFLFYFLYNLLVAKQHPWNLIHHY